MSVLVGKPAPDFKTNAVVKGEIIPDFTLSQFKGKKEVILFFYPLDFTFVCPTELHAFQQNLSKFEERGVQIIGCSVDSHFSHLAWVNTPKKQGGIEGVTYPLVSDLSKSIAANYDVLVEGVGIAYRGLFLIDKKGIVRHQIVNDLPLGRSIHEALRMVEALQFFEKHGEVCPANWQEGDRAMKPTHEGLKEYFKS
ncbi:MAG: thioredoxin peroxidase [Deltaproteobacteria bacterium RIFCSPLOWO2_02_FULL_50_16]|nr:MAG: thioredoxin peroxidase [Deltaproteobacteria bacterium RIFCSPHIGHO2_02_FULL_50_15]OGQ56436.1 MAG: thioredoxin peroxidase [Deltaproteobacteria bacterium RIFCSPLOWO2_02_FULL_50_16]OGQ66839.1 MAG: thioredoxin peroxidase [Deltaproteobacteria bacterium RIFCSPLOWO2_12_FULL_50_11]